MEEKLPASPSDFDHETTLVYLRKAAGQRFLEVEWTRSNLNAVDMRPLTDEEMKVLFGKLFNYVGKNIEQLINRPDEKYCFRLHKDRVYYVR